MKDINKGRIIFLLILIVITTTLIFSMDFECKNIILIPFLFILFYIAPRFDVPLRGLGYVNADHIVVFPSAYLLSNSLIVGLLCSFAYLLERVIREGIKKLRMGIIISFFITIINTTVACYLFLKSEIFSNNQNVLLSWLYLCLILIVFALLGFFLLVLDRVFYGVSFDLKWWLKYVFEYVVFLLITSPFLALFLFSLEEKNASLIVLTAVPLIANIWFLRVNFKFAEKNESLIEINKKMEFLQQLLLQETGSLDNENFLKDLLSGVKEFVKWDKDLLYISSLGFEKEPIIFSLEDLPQDTHSAISYIDDLLDNLLQIRDPIIKKDFTPILDKSSKVQMIIPLSTNEISFGVLLIEKYENKEFTNSEIQFLQSTFSLIARFIQDRILKGQLLTTNQTLLKQTHYLSEILKISNLLKIHLSSHEILQEVARGISESIGFKRVLVSLYRSEQKHFERIAGFGLQEEWEKISSIKPPEEKILCYLKEEYRIGNCYLVRNVAPTEYTILPKRGKKKETDSWQPDDALFIPLISSNNTLLGVISIDEPEDGKIPPLETLNALEILANQAVHALESAKIHSEAKHQSIVDGLTNLYNHRYFQESLSKLIQHSSISGKPFSILMMDLDNFKEINDTYGHLAGDAVLKGVGETLIEVTRKNDVAARYGGEEFAVLLEGLDSSQARMVAERIRSLIEKRVVYEESNAIPLSATISIGIASYPQHGKENKELLKVADLALYRAKQAGKNRVAEGP